RQSIPCRQHLVITARMNAFLARRKERCFDARQSCLRIGERNRQSLRDARERLDDAQMPCVLLEVRWPVETEVERCDLPFARPQQRANFIGRPYIKLSLFAFAVGVEARPERAIRRAHLAYEPADDGARNVAERRLARCASQIGVERDERPVVVEHLLEMWNRPFGVNAVAAETTAEMIIDAAFGHPRERRANDRQ